MKFGHQTLCYVLCDCWDKRFVVKVVVATMYLGRAIVEDYYFPSKVVWGQLVMVEQLNEV